MLRKSEEERRTRRRGKATSGNEVACPTSGSSPAASTGWKSGDKSLIVAYLLYFVGGWLGLHHLYLDRPIQAGLWACSPCFGFFGFGLLRDFFRMSEYVAVRNADTACEEHLLIDMRQHKVPPHSVWRIIGIFGFGWWFGFVGSRCGPEWLPPLYFVISKGLAVGLGIWLAGSACTHQGGSLKATLSASVVGGGVIGTFAFLWFREWQPESTKPRPAKRKVIFLVGAFWFLSFYGIYEHSEIVAEVGNDGDQNVKLKDAIWNILRGIEYKDFKSFYDSTGWEDFDFDGSSFWSKLSQSLDVKGQRRALRTLGMESFVGKPYSAEDVKKHYKQLARQWHPDHARAGKKQEAEAMMAEINQAKYILDQVGYHS